MKDFKKGDILVGKKRNFTEAFHPIVYISGSIQAPLAVVLTHSGGYPCNMRLQDEYPDEKGKVEPSFVIRHLIQKIEAWGPYTKKIGELSMRDLETVDGIVSGLTEITYLEYEEYTKKGHDCPEHGTLLTHEKGRSIY